MVTGPVQGATPPKRHGRLESPSPVQKAKNRAATRSLRLGVDVSPGEFGGNAVTHGFQVLPPVVHQGSSALSMGARRRWASTGPGRLMFRWEKIGRSRI
jgi:hypothetical protein